MMSIDQMVEYFEHAIAESRLDGDKTELRQLQTAAGVIMKAANAANDTETARRFRVVAAEAANKQEELESDN